MLAVPFKMSSNNQNRTSTRAAFNECSFQKFLSLQPQAMFASSSVGQLTHNSSGMSSSIWILDSGTSHHMSPDSSCFTSMSHSSYVLVMIVDGTSMSLAGVGSIVSTNLSLSFSLMFIIF